MDTLRLLAHGTVRIEVNGIPLLAHCVDAVRHLGDRAVEQARAYTDVQVDSADLRAHFHGTSDHTWSPDDEEDDDDEDPMLLGCTCGFDHCSPVTARITVTDETVTWSDFRSGTDWDASLVGPFVFDRSQYDEAVRSATLPGLTKGGRLRP
jgi:hypothetical protein